MQAPPPLGQTPTCLFWSEFPLVREPGLSHSPAALGADSTDDHCRGAVGCVALVLWRTLEAAGVSGLVFLPLLSASESYTTRKRTLASYTFHILLCFWPPARGVGEEAWPIVGLPAGEAVRIRALNLTPFWKLPRAGPGAGPGSLRTAKPPATTPSAPSRSGNCLVPGCREPVSSRGNNASRSPGRTWPWNFPAAIPSTPGEPVSRWETPAGHPGLPRGSRQHRPAGAAPRLSPSFHLCWLNHPRESMSFQIYLVKLNFSGGKL